MNPSPSAARPTLLTIGMACSGILGAVFLFLLMLAPFNIGTFTIDKVPVTGPEFLRRGGVVFFAVCALLIAIGITLGANYRVSRHLMIAFWLVLGIVSIVPSFREAGDLDCTWLFALAIAVWYLYFKSNVVAYYKGIASGTAVSEVD
jgi:hypothetical protein